MEQVLDGLRRIIARWVITKTPLTGDTFPNMGPGVSDILTVRTVNRFNVGDEVILRRAAKDGELDGKYEKPDQFQVAEIIDNTHLRLNQQVKNPWLAADGAVLVKAMNGLFVQGIYIGDPENISHYPAITVNGISQDSEWLTLDSVKDTFNVEITTFVQDSTQEAGYRFLLRLTKLIRLGLRMNLFPLVNDYATSAVTLDMAANTNMVQVQDASIFCVGNVVLVENAFITIENRVSAIDLGTNTLTLQNTVPVDFRVQDDSIVIQVHRFIFNSYPKTTQYGKIHKGTLMKASVIDWFGWEEVFDPTHSPWTTQGAWTDTQLQ